jgi:NADPH:quinone reductase-like Zn-dependent oxidoreductase
VVETVGEGVTAFAPGDKVIALSGIASGQPGTYAEYACVPEMRTLKLPRGLSLAEGATVPIASASAASSIIDVAKAKAGDKVFLNGGAGSVGTFGIQYLKYIGCSVAATCSTRNIGHVRLMGADLVIDYTKENIGDEIRKWAPDGLDSVIDAVGQHSLPRETPDWIRPGGTLVMIQNLLTGVEAFDLESAAARNVWVVDNVIPARTPDPSWFQVDAWRRMVAAIDRGAVQVPPYEVLPLEQAAEAQRRVEDGHVRGKILLKVTDI